MLKNFKSFSIEIDQKQFAKDNIHPSKQNIVMEILLEYI